MPSFIARPPHLARPEPARGEHRHIPSLLEIVPGDPARLHARAQRHAGDAGDPARDASASNGRRSSATSPGCCGLFRGDFGISYTYRCRSPTSIADAHLDLAAAGLFYALTLSTADRAFRSASSPPRRRNSATDVADHGRHPGSASPCPNFWFAMLLVLLFAVTLRWFSAGGFPGWAGPLSRRSSADPAGHRAGPAAGLDPRPRHALLAPRHAGRGLHPHGPRQGPRPRGGRSWRHALRNALIPVLTIIGLQFSFLLAGAIIIENVFFLPGLGRLVFQAHHLSAT